MFLNSDRDLFTNALHYITEVINNSVVIVETGINVAHPRYSCSELIELIEALLCVREMRRMIIQKEKER